MELRYRRRIKMPVWSLPGFNLGFNGQDGQYHGLIDEAQHRTQRSLIANQFGVTIGYPDQKPIPVNTGSWQPNTGWYPQEQPTLDTTIHTNMAYWNTNGTLKNNTDTILGQFTAPKPGTLGSYESNGGGDSGKQDDTDSTEGDNKQKAGFKLNRISGEQWANIGQSTIGMAAAGMQSFGPVASQGELLANAGQRTAYGADYNWTKQNNIDTAGEMSDLRKENTANTFKATSAGLGLGTSVGTAIGVAGGAAAGGVAGPIGAGVGALLGFALGMAGAGHRKSQLQRRIFNAQQQVNHINTFNNASAQTGALQRNYLSEYGNPYGGSIYNAKYGKDSGTAITAKTRARLFNSKLSLPDVNKG